MCLKDVRRDPREAGVLGDASERLADALDRLALELDHRRLGYAEPTPATDMGEQAVWQTDGRLTLLGLPRADSQPAKESRVEVDVPTTDSLNERRPTNRAGPGSGIERHEDETRDVLARASVGRPVILNLPVTPGGPDQPSRFGAGQPSLARQGPIRQNDRDDRVAVALLTMMIDRSAQVLKLTPRQRLRPAMLGIVAAELAVDLTQPARAEESEQRLDPLAQLDRAAHLVGAEVLVDAQDVRDRNDVGVAPFGPGRLVLVGDVRCEALFSLRTFANAASSANLSRSVPDDPDRRLSFSGSEPESRSLGSLRHLSLMSSIAASVV